MRAPGDENSGKGFERDPVVELNSEEPSLGSQRRQDDWTAERQDLLQRLAAEDQLCAQLFREAIEALSSTPLDVGKLVVGGHAIRELVNRLPAVLGDASTFPQRVDDAALRRELVTAWQEYASGGTPREGDEPGASLRLEDALRAWAEAQTQIAMNMEVRRAALVSPTLEDADENVVRMFASAVGVFERFRHPSASRIDSLPDPGTIKEALNVIESTISSRLLGFFDAKRLVSDVVREANRRGSDGKWLAPSEQEVTAVVARLGGLQRRRVFFDELANPEWVEPLDRLNALDAPRFSGSDGGERWLPWPAGDYLVRIAKHRPQAVRQILMRTLTRETGWYSKTRMVAAAVRMPPSESVQLTSAILANLVGAVDPNDASDLVDLIEHLAQAGEMHAALRLAQRLLRPIESTSRGLGRKLVSARVDSYWYAPNLERVINALRSDSRLLPTVYMWLRTEQELSEAWDPDRDWNFSNIQRPSISEHPQNFGRRELDNALIDALRDLAISEVRAGRDVGRVLATLTRDGLPLGQRIALFMLSDLVSTKREEVLEVARQSLLDPDIFRGRDWFREYAQLAAKTLPLLGDETYSAWEALVNSNERLSEGLRERILKHRREDETEEEALDDYLRVRRHELLSAIGSPSLRGALLLELDTLDASRGVYEHAGFQSWHETTVGYEVPAIASELKTMSIDQVLRAVRDWESDDRADGLGHALNDAVAERSQEFSACTREFLELPEPFPSRFLDGLRAAVSVHSSAIDWPAYLSGVSQLRVVRAGGAEEFSYPMQTVCHTLARAASEEGSALPADLLQAVVEAISDWADAQSPSDNGELGADHLTMALNSTRPMVVSTVARVMRAAKVREQEGFDASGVIAAGKEVLNSRLAPRDESLAVAAAFGQALGMLLWVDEEWAREWVLGVLRQDAWSDVLVTTALKTNPTSLSFLGFLWSAIDAMLDREEQGESVEVGWRTDETFARTVGDHLMSIYMWDPPAPWNERIEGFFTRVNADVAASVLGHVGWRLMQTTEPTVEILQRARVLWDSRQTAVDEGRAEPRQLGQFYWWVHSGHFDISWWLPRLRRVVDQVDVEGRSFIGEHLEEAAKTHPMETIELMMQLLRGADETRMLYRHGLVSAAPSVIARGLPSESPAVSVAAQQLMDLLGEQGIVDMDAQVERAAREIADTET